MSAQALLSLLAPAVPAASQGASTAEPSVTDGLFASLLGGELTGDNDDAPEADLGSEAEAAPVAPAPVLVPPTSQPLTLLLETPTSAEAAPPAPTPTVVAAPPPEPTLPLAPPTPTSPTAPLPDVSPPIAAAPAPIKTPTPDADIPVETTPAALTAKADAASQPVTPPPAAPAPVAPPALRPLAERTAKPLDAESASASAPTDASVAAPTPADTPAAPSAKPAAPGDAPAPLIATVGETAASDGDALSAPSSEAQADAAPTPALRDAGLSHLSRAAIDATAQIAAQIIRKLDGRSTRFEMALTPDDLGRVDVKLDIDSEGRLAARLAFDNPAAATDLRGRADELRRQLESQGFILADDAFEFAERDSGSHAFDRGQDRRDGQSRAFSAASRVTAEADARPGRWTPLSLSPSGVDLKV